MTAILTYYLTGFAFGAAIWLMAYWCGRIDAKNVSYLDGYEHGLIEARERGRDGK